MTTKMMKTLGRLENIQNEIHSLVSEAEKLVRANASSGTYNRAVSYWIPQIRESLGGTDTCSMENTLREMRLEEVGPLKRPALSRVTKAGTR